MTIQRRNLVLGLATLPILAGCGAISAIGDAATPLDAYELRAPALPQAGRALQRGLSIELPTTSGALDTDRILIRPNAVQSLYISGARWSDEMPAMFQTVLLRGFEDTGALSYVGRRPLGAVGDFALISDITDFQAELSEDQRTAVIRIRLTARLVRETDAAILARRSFQSLAAAGSTETLDLIQTFNRASDVVVEEVVRWALQGMGQTLPSA